MDFKKNTRRQTSEKKQEKSYIIKDLYALFEGRERVFDAFEIKILPIKIEDTGFPDTGNLKILTPKQMI